VTALISRFRGPAVAVVVLALTAGAALAGGGGMPAASEFGLETARDASGQEVPLGLGLVEDSDEETEEPAAEEEEEELVEEEQEEEETEDASEHCTDVDPANHGALVCWAAQNEPDGWTGNHGEWVSCVARLSNNGHVVEPAEGEEVEPIVWTDMTPESCGEAIQAAKEAKAAEREAAKAERAAERANAKAARDAAKAERAAGKQHGRG